MSSTSDDDVTPLDGDSFLAANRAARERIRAEEDGESTDGDPDGAESDAAETPGRRSPLVVGLTAAVVVLAVAVGVLGYLLATDDSSPDDLDRAGALRDGKSYAATMFTYQPGKYDDLDRRIRDIATSEFADQYIRSSQLARKANDAAQASSKATASVAGLISISADEAVVLVALDQVVTSPEAPALGRGNPPYQSRVEITLSRDGDRWLASDLKQI